VKRFLFTALQLVTITTISLAGVQEEWADIVALDAGPKKPPSSREEAVQLARNHFLVQRKALEQFLARYPADPHAFDARLRLAAILAAEGMMDRSPSQVDAAMRLLGELEKTPGIPREKLADVGFQRTSLILQNQIASTDRMRETVVSAARNFAAKYPGDRRGPRLLVEAATICDDVPHQKRDLLEEALRTTTEESLKHHINDDLARLALLGRPLELKLSSVQAGPIDLPALRGNVVVIVFWATESPHSLLWLRDFRLAWEKMPKDQLRVVTISLDENRRALDERLRDLPPSWPTHFDGKGWLGPVVRSLGINALPTVWILDKKGVLRTLNARESYTTQIQNLLRE
jgi:hypothetical protein